MADSNPQPAKPQDAKPPVAKPQPVKPQVAPVAKPQPAKPQAPKQPEIKYLVRVANTDLNGKKPIGFALSYVPGVGISFAHVACRIAKIDIFKKTGYLSDAELKKIEEIIKNPIKHGIPTWLLNRQRDFDTGEDKHLLTGDLQFQVEMDIKMMKKMRSYKGVRHMFGAPVRGQRTRSNFRKNKGKVMGVKRSAAAKSSSGST